MARSSLVGSQVCLFGPNKKAGDSGVGRYIQDLRRCLDLDGIETTVIHKTFLGYLIGPVLGIAARKMLIFGDESWAIHAIVTSYYRPCILVVHDTRWIERHKTPVRVLYSLAERYRRLYLCCVSTNTVERVKALFGQRVCTRLIANSIEKTGGPKIWNREIQKLLYVGSFEERKNVAGCIRFAAKLGMPLEIRTTSFYLNKACKLLRKEIEENRCVKLVVDLPYESLYTQDVDKCAFISLSDFEGFGRCYLEAQVHGMPVIALANNATGFVLKDSALIINAIDDYGRAKLALGNEEVVEDLIRRGYENAKRFEFNGYKDSWNRLVRDCWSA